MAEPVDTAGALPAASEAPIHLRILWVRFLRRLPIFFAVAAAIMVAAVVFTLTRTPTYTAAASVLIEQGKNQILKDQADVSGGMPADSQTVDTQVQMLGSRAVAARVVEVLHLDKDAEFNPALGAKTVKGVGMLLKDARPGSQDTQLTGENPALSPVIDAIQARTNVRRTGLTYVIQVSFTSLNPLKAANIANAIANEFINAEAEAKFNVAHNAGSWLNGRLVTLQNEVQAADAAVQQYKVAHNLMSANGATMAEQEVSILDQQIAVARADQAEKEATLAAAKAQIARGGGGADVGAALTSGVVSSLRAQRAQLSAQQADLETKYGPLHPSVQKVHRQLADIDQQISQEIGRNISNLQSQVDVSRQRLSSLLGSRGSAQGTLGSNNQAMVQLMELQRKADASKAVYEAFLNRTKEISAQEGIQQADARVSSPAQAPMAPTSPNVKLNLALGLVLSVLGGLAVVLLLENLDGGLRTSNDIESKLQMPSLGAIPQLQNASEAQRRRYIVEKPFSSFSESFRSLKTSLMFSRTDREIKLVAVTSALPGEGKTLSTLSFGRSIAMSGTKVLIIDADLRRRMMTAAAEVTVTNGLVEVLEGKVDLASAIVKDEASGAYMLLLSDTPAPTADLLSGPALAALFEQAKRDYEMIIIDTAPVLAVAETRAIAALADATLFLVRWSKTPKQASAAALDLLINAGAFVAGVCLTQVNLAQQARLGYGDKLYYYQAYRKYYSE